MQVHAEAGQQLEADLRLFFQQAPVMAAVEAYQAARLERASGHRVLAGDAEQQGLGETLAGHDHLYQLLVAVGEYPGQFHLTCEQHVEAVGRLTLMEQDVATAQPAVDRQAAQGVEGRLWQPIEQVMLAQGLLCCRVSEHGPPPMFTMLVARRSGSHSSPVLPRKWQGRRWSCSACGHTGCVESQPMWLSAGYPSPIPRLPPASAAPACAAGSSHGPSPCLR
ncbi:hypothetical protein FQZ97_746950 [compost metagenome]